MKRALPGLANARASRGYAGLAPVGAVPTAADPIPSALRRTLVSGVRDVLSSAYE